MTRFVLTTLAALLAVLAMAPSAWAVWTWPLRGELITAFRNGADPYAGGQHRGIDIAGDPGAPVVAAEAGTVRFAGTAGSSGLTVSVQTADGAYDTAYLHLSAIAVQKGDVVAAGAPIGEVGTTGVRSVERAHLHFGVRDAGSRHAYRDPLSLLPPGPVAGDVPRAAPTPVAAPAPVAPEARRVAPAPDARRVPGVRRVPAPAPRATPVPQPTPRLAPRPSPTLAPHTRPAPVPGGVPTREPDPSPGQVAASLPASASVPQSARAGAPGRAVAPTVGPASHSSEPPAQVPPGARPAVRSGSEPAGAGPDLGLMLACLGLVAAAALLGLSEDGRAATRRTSKRAAGLLRPLLGRR